MTTILRKCFFSPLKTLTYAILFTSLWITTNTKVAAAIHFSPDTLNKIAMEAVTEAEKSLEKKSEQEILNLATTFYLSSPIFTSSPSLITDLDKDNLIKSYRTEFVLQKTYELFKEKYPDLILKKPTWMWNNVGLVFARMLVLYCSVDEYLVLWGTQMKQQGFSGYYPFMDEYDFMLAGTMYSHSPDPSRAVPVLYKPLGRYSNLKPGDSRHYSLDDYTYMISYAKGDIAKAFYQGLIAPSIFVNHDSESFRIQMKDCGIEAIRNLFRLGN